MVYYADFESTKSLNDYLMSIEEEYVRVISIETVAMKLNDGETTDIFRVWLQEL